jgi:hypothetical protein
VVNGDQERYRPKREAFGRWLLAQRGHGNWVDDVADAARRDPAFPKDGSPEEVRKRMIDKGADSETLEALDDAERAWWSL